ncbi:hypothetical protein ACFRCW_36500 [Streptomyces sp. NPDC056653]|uniref:hypothetical protein n=1 Tax=Streptomyces sp. NPDC056653 TaxID=3345894 RepID=UPI0036B21628
MTAVRDLQVVLGAGPAGTTLARELVDRGHPVRLVDRAGGGAAIEGVERFAADVATPDGARAAVEGAAVVYHCVNVGYHLQVEVMPRIQEAVLAAAEAVGAHPDSDGRVWHLPTAPALTTRQIFTMIEQRTGRPLDITVVDEPRPVGPFDEVFMAEYAEMFYQHTEPQIVDSSAIEKAYGLTANPLAATVDATLAWYEQLLAAR